MVGQSTPDRELGNWELQNVAENNDHIHNAEPLGNFLGTQTL